MYGDKPEPQVPKTVDFSGRRFQPLAAPHRRHVQDECVLASSPGFAPGPAKEGQAPMVVAAQAFQTDNLELGLDGLIEAVGMSKLNQVKDSHAHAGNAAQDQQAALNNALPQSLTPVMPHPGLGPSASSEPPPWQHSSSSSAPASAPYPVSTLPLSALPPSLKAHQTSRDHRLPPRIALSPPILTPLHPPPGP